MDRAMKNEGFTLVELMIAVAIGGLIIVAALVVYAQGSAVNRVNETIARLQERGRYAFSVMEPDVALAGLYGFSNLPDSVRLVSSGDPAAVIATAVQMRQFPLLAGDPLPAAVTGLPAGAHVCGVNFALDVSLAAQGSNNVFELGRGRTSGCNPYSSGAQPGTDTVTLRHTEVQAAAPAAGRLQIYASRLTSAGQLLFADGRPPGMLDSDHHIFNFAVRSYYIARDSVGRKEFPALRVKSLSRSGTSLVFDEDEVMPGIEDLQVQFGIDTGDGDNDGWREPNRRVTRYVNPDFAELPRHTVAAVRIWLRIRADQPEVGYVDDRSYRYADVVYTPAGAQRGYRRMLMSRTIVLRNARRY